MHFLFDATAWRRARRVLYALGFASIAGLGAAAGACGGDTLPNPDNDYDAGTKNRDSGGLDGAPVEGDSSLPEASTCTATPCVRAIGVGGEFACAVTDDGSVYCWGANFRAQVGVATDDGGLPSNVAKPTKIALAGPAQAVALGFFHACALLKDGSVACWGYNDDSEVGLAKSGPVVKPSAVAGIAAPAKQIVAGGYHTCVLLLGGEAVCWGYNNAGQLGTLDGDGGLSNKAKPATVTKIDHLLDLGAGDRFTCAVLADGGVDCFGTNSSGSLGRNTSDFTAHVDPAPVLGLAGPVATLGHSAGYHQHVVLADGRLQGWGGNTSGEIGTGTSGSSVNQATLVPGLTNVAEVAPGSFFTCARMTDGTVKCWGENGAGQTGVAPDAGTTQLAPTPVRGISDAISVRAGLNDFACALLSGGSVVCWGSNSSGQLGRGNVGGFDPNPAPVAF